MAILPVGLSAEEGGYQIERSLRFNSADSAYLSRTPASAGNRKTWTWSCWFKRSNIGGSYYRLFNAHYDTSNRYELYFDTSSNTLTSEAVIGGTGYYLTTSQVFRDPSAWYHIVIAMDTTQATSSNRHKIYINGVQVTSFSTASYPNQNADVQVNGADPHNIGRSQAYSGYFDGYMAEIHLVDGSALAPTSFGEFDTTTGVWKPKEYTGSYGTNGFYLDFGDNSSTTALGYDAAGSNDWTPNNFSVTAGAGNDSLVDTPTQYGTDTGAGGEVRGNYATLNPLDQSSGMAVVNGNLQAANGNNAWHNCRATFQLPSSGKFYWEITIYSLTYYALVGLANSSLGLTTQLGTNANGWAWQSNAFKAYNGSSASWGTAASVNDVIMLAVDMDSNKMWVGRQGTWFESGNPATGVNEMYAGLPSTGLFPVLSMYNAGVYANFGQRPFAYTAPSGFAALCTTNLPEPTIADGGEYFNAVTYSGTNSNQSITGVGFQPDFMWAKARSIGYTHNLQDAVRGSNKVLFSNLTNAEGTQNSGHGVLSFDSDGFSLGLDSSTSGSINASGQTYVAWNWKANGAGVSNTDGTITSTVSANTTAGFSAVSWTGTGSTGTVGHGLGAAPSLIIAKRRNASTNWQVYHRSLTASNQVCLNLTNASFGTTTWNSTEPTSSVFSIDNAELGTNGATMIAYCFAPIAGYSAFGSYQGSGSADGPFVYTGFRPAFVIIKEADNANDWHLIDSQRESELGNPVQAWLRPNASDAEASSDNDIDLLSNGFKARSTGNRTNRSGGTLIYMAFAENPFKYSLGR